MKKLLSLTLALIMCLNLCACGGNSIQLTLDNYEKYLNVSSGFSGCFDSVFNIGSYPLPGGGGTYYLYDFINTTVRVKGASTNFNYNDVVVEVRITGTYTDVDVLNKREKVLDFAFDYTLQCDITGNALESQRWEAEHWTHEGLCEYTLEVVSISGSVTPA